MKSNKLSLVWDYVSYIHANCFILKQFKIKMAKTKNKKKKKKHKKNMMSTSLYNLYLHFPTCYIMKIGVCRILHYNGVLSDFCCVFCLFWGFFNQFFNLFIISSIFIMDKTLLHFDMDKICSKVPVCQDIPFQIHSSWKSISDTSNVFKLPKGMPLMHPIEQREC